MNRMAKEPKAKNLKNSNAGPSDEDDPIHLDTKAYFRQLKFRLRIGSLFALVDLKMPGINGEETLKALKAEHKWMEVVILTGHGTIDSAVECTKGGAYSYLQKPCSLDELMESLINAYKNKVMNKKKIEDKKMAELLKISLYNSPKEILRRLKEIDKG